MSEAGMSNTDKLAAMAGQIADYFKAYPDEQAAESIASHINKFWARRMREDFVAHFTPDDTALKPLVRKALPKIKAARAGG